MLRTKVCASVETLGQTKQNCVKYFRYEEHCQSFFFSLCSVFLDFPFIELEILNLHANNKRTSRPQSIFFLYALCFTFSFPSMGYIFYEFSVASAVKHIGTMICLSVHQVCYTIHFLFCCLY